MSACGEQPLRTRHLARQCRSTKASRRDRTVDYFFAVLWEPDDGLETLLMVCPWDLNNLCQTLLMPRHMNMAVASYVTTVLALIAVLL
jgi:hypothetical protein